MKIKIISILIISLLLYGCGSGAKQPKVTDYDVRVGTQGLIMNFLLGAPPKEIFETESFEIRIDAMNKGAFDIEQGHLAASLEDDYIALEGWESEDMVIGEGKQASFKLKGKSLERKVGEQTIFIVSLTALDIPEEKSETHMSNIIITACYPYETKKGVTVCIDTDPYNFRSLQKVCKIKDITPKGGQGGPVAVTRIQTEMLPHKDPDKIKPQFIILIENTGNGQVIKAEKKVIRDACSASPLNYTDINTVYVDVSLGGDLGDKKKQGVLECLPGDKYKGIARLKNNKATIRCSLKEGVPKERGSYSSLLKIGLDYGYTTSISSNILIKKALKY